MHLHTKDTPSCWIGPRLPYMNRECLKLKVTIIFQVLNPALNSLLGDEQWDVWLESLDAAKLETGQVEGLIAKHKEHIRS